MRVLRSHRRCQACIFLCEHWILWCPDAVQALDISCMFTPEVGCQQQVFSALSACVAMEGYTPF